MKNHAVTKQKTALATEWALTLSLITVLVMTMVGCAQHQGTEKKSVRGAVLVQGTWIRQIGSTIGHRLFKIRKFFSDRIVPAYYMGCARDDAPLFRGGRIRRHRPSGPAGGAFLILRSWNGPITGNLQESQRIK